MNIIDIRSKSKYLKSHMPGAINIDSYELLFNPSKYLNINEKVVYIVSIIFAVVVYILELLVFGILKEDELKQLPMGDKIAKIAKKFKKM